MGSNMNNDIYINVIGNAGVYIRYKNFGVIVDGFYEGFYDKERWEFADLEDETVEALYTSKAPFEALDYVLITHCHKDHFSAEKTMLLVQNQKLI